MARRRMIESDIWRDDFIYDLSILGRLLWIGLVTTCADDQGRLRYHPRLIRSDVFPLDDIPAEEIESLLQAFSRAGRVVIYQAGGKDLLQIVNWWQYQTPAWALPSKYPPPPGWTDREKHHAPGNQVLSRNWDHQGGFQAGWTNPATQDSALQGDALQVHAPDREMPRDNAPQGDVPQGSVPGENFPAAQDVLPGASPFRLSTNTSSPLHSRLHSALYSLLCRGLRRDEDRALNDDDVKDECEDESCNPLAFFVQIQSIIEEITGPPVVGMESIAANNELCAMRATREAIKGRCGWPIKKYWDLIHPGSLSETNLPSTARRTHASRAPPASPKSRARPPSPTAILTVLPGSI